MDAVATSPVTTQTPVVAVPGGNESVENNGKELPFKVPQQKQKFNSKAEETIAGFRINDPTPDEIEDVAATEALIDRAQAAAQGDSNESHKLRAKNGNQTPSGEDQSAALRERLKVGDEEFELDAEQIKRFAQKGIYHEKNNRKAAERERALQAKEQQLAQLEQQAIQTFEALKNPQSLMSLIESMHGKEQARRLTEGYLRPLIEREMLPPEQQQALSLQERAEMAEAQLAKQQFMQQQQMINARAQELQNHYQQQIIGALEKLNLPTGSDFTFLAREMATWMERGIQNNIDYTPEQLAEKVLEDNNLRVGLLVSHEAQEILKARQAKDLNKVIQLGESLAQKLGDPVVYAIAKYHLAKHERQQQALPQREILSTPKVAKTATQKSGYMTPDEYAAERKRRVAMMERGEDPGEWT